MKTKKFVKKLHLNKKTIVDLNNDEMGQLHGGIDKSRRLSECPSDCIISACCPTVNCPTDTCHNSWCSGTCC
jgi:hypothetical protein